MKLYKKVLFWIWLVFSFLLGFFIYHFWGTNLNESISRLFMNTAGQFDLAIFWAAIASLATLFLGIVSLVQNSRLNKRNRELEESREIVQNSSHIYSCYSPEIKERIVTATKDMPLQRKERNENPPLNQVYLKINESCWYTLSFDLRYAFSNRPTKFTVKNAKLKLSQNGISYDLSYKNSDIKDQNFKDITPDTKDKLALFLLFEIKKLDNFNFNKPYKIDINLEYIFANTWNSNFIVCTDYLCYHRIDVEEIYAHTVIDSFAIPQSGPYKTDKFFK